MTTDVGGGDHHDDEFSEYDNDINEDDNKKEYEYNDYNKNNDDDGYDDHYADVTDEQMNTADLILFPSRKGTARSAGLATLDSRARFSKPRITNSSGNTEIPCESCFWTPPQLNRVSYDSW